ncbi:MAG TPA: ABC transporter permease, partial [Stellaceae bacterium]|nr:ABC transporter permease [Stellaceae bacterium]
MTAATAIHAAPIRLHNQVVLALAVVAALAIVACGFVSLAPNRLLSGKPVMLWHAAGPAAAVIGALFLALAALAFVPARRAVHVTATILAAILFVAVLYTAGDAAHRLGVGAPKLARISLGAGFWVLLGAAALAIVDGLQRAGAGPVPRLAIVLAVAAAAVALGEAGWFDALSLAREYHNRHAVFAAAIIRHVALVVGSVAPAIAIAVPLGILALRRERWRGPVFATLNLLQTVPSIALFALLIAPLSALGLGGIGPV